MTLLVRDEADIVADMLEYHLARGVDHVVATDNGSVDGTLEILERYRDRGVLTLLHESSREYLQPEWVTRMARLAVTEHGADWVLHADADEIFWPNGADGFKPLLEAVPDGLGAVVAPVLHFRPRVGVEGPWHARLTVRDSVSVKPGGGPVYHVLHRAHPDAVVGPANKVVTGPGLGVVPAWRPISCLHFPMRSWEQYQGKVVRGGRAFKPWSWDEHVEGGGLEAFFRSHLVDDDAVRAGVRDGSLVLDERVARWFAGEGATELGGGGTLAWPELDPAVAELRAQAAERGWIEAHDPENDPVLQLRTALRRLRPLARRRVERLLRP
jgi:hypothetical protein